MDFAMIHQSPWHLPTLMIAALVLLLRSLNIASSVPWSNSDESQNEVSLKHMWLLSWGMELTTQKWLSSNPLPPMSCWQWPQPQRKPAWVLTLYLTIHSGTREKIPGDGVITGALSPVWRQVYQTEGFHSASINRLESSGLPGPVGKWTQE